MDGIYRDKVIIGFTLGTAISFLTFAFVIGCEPKPHLDPKQAPDVLAVPNTVFAPPTEVPSVTPAADAAADQAGVVQQGATALYPKVAALTPATIEQRKPAVLESFQMLMTEIQRMIGFASQAQAQSRSNDVAVATLTAEVTAARELVRVREEQLKQSEERHAADLRHNEEAFAQIRIGLEDQIRTLEQEAKTSQLRTVRWICSIGVGLGGLGIVAGTLMSILMPVKRMVGFVVAGAGALCVCLGMAGLYYGQELALAGLVLAAVMFIGAVWAAIHYLRRQVDDTENKYKVAAIEIADGVQQAILAGKIEFADVKAHFAQAQSPLARQLVQEAIT